MWQLRDQRISFLGSKGIWTLKITNVTKDDQGQYKCVFKTHPPVSQTGSLKLIGPIFVGEVKNLTVNEGERASFTCQVENLTKYHKIGWYRLHPRKLLSVGLTRKSDDPRLSVMHDDNMKWTLQITNVTRYDRGTYQCTVNFNGTSIIQFAHLYVRVKDQCNIRTYFLSWHKIKAQLGNSEIEEADVKSILLQSKTNVKGIYIKWCPSLRTSCPNGRTQCVPSVERRNVSVGINVGNTQKLLHFNYLEATKCFCKFCKLEQYCTVKFPVIFKPKIIDELFRPDFFNSTTIELTWEEVKKNVRKPSQVSGPEVFNILRKSRLIDDYKIPVKECPSDFCKEPSVSMIPAYPSIKHISLPIKVINGTKTAILEYVEVTKCYCSAAKLKVRLMETILHVKIEELCLQSDDVNESGMTLTSYIGCDIMMPFYFPHQSEDVTRITVIKATDSGKPLSIRSPLRTDLVTYDASQSWVRSVEFEICEGVVELRLKNVTYAFNDTYYCIVESKNTSACFSQVNLIVAEKIPEKGCPVNWKPKKTSLDWNTFLQRLDNATILTRLIPKETELNETFPLQICPAEPISCLGPLKPQHCVASRSRTRLKTVCVPRENDEMKIEIEYEEDDTCECRLSNVSLPNWKAILDHQETKLVAIVRAEHVGNCPSACRPQKYKVEWQYIKEVISNQTSYSIPNFVPGENIWVKRCPQDLTTCEATGKKCGASVYEMKEKKMEITDFKRLHVVKYLELEKCKCQPASEIDPRDSELFIFERFDSKPLR
ncbi:LOW QUALITY PROTEIN: uncharacterized protein [Palaemon carinicauda]|uniref:LOW QUALITY PROTEIN: uncharacterized protein n=1 Tax=Palaemon carinicauda TaxID=392227 RepID=UPI0035B5C343